MQDRLWSNKMNKKATARPGPACGNSQRKGKREQSFSERDNIMREIERLEKISRQEIKHLPLYIRKKFTPYIYNGLEPYTFPKEAKHLRPLEPKKSHGSALCRPTAISTQEEWKNLKLEHPVQFPHINKKPLVQQNETQSQCTLEDIQTKLRLLEEYAQSSCPEPKITISQIEKVHKLDETYRVYRGLSQTKTPTKEPQIKIGLVEKVKTPSKELQIKIGLLEKLEEQLRIDHDMPPHNAMKSSKSAGQIKEKGKNIKKTKSASKASDKPQRRLKVKDRPQKQTSRSISTASECVTGRPRASDPKPPSTPPPTYPRVSLSVQPQITARLSQLNHDDVPMIRELVNKKNMKVNHIDKELADYLRTKHNYQRFAKHRASHRPKGRQKLRLEETYYAYMQNSPGSSKAIKECLQGSYFLTREAQNKEIRRFSSGGIGCF